MTAKRNSLMPPKEMGRSTLWQPEYPEPAKRACRLGATNQGLADFFEVSLSCIENWMQTQPEFLRAIKEGRLWADAHVADSLYQRAIGHWLPRPSSPDCAAIA